MPATGAKVSEPESFARFIARYCERTRGSKAYRQTFRNVLADSRASAGFRRSLKEIQYPIVGSRAAGSHVWDIDGNAYVDIAMGFGVQLFGHDAAFIRDALHEQLTKGLYLGPQAPLAGEVARQICAMTGVERVCFCNTGTEAVMTSLRLARAATRRNKIAMFKWSYHGHFDETLGRPRLGGGQNRTVPLAPGVSPKFVDHVVMLDYGEPASFKALDPVRDELSAVIVEPVQGMRPHVQPKAFLHELRRWCDRHEVVLIFDEILVGFRIQPGGAQAHFGVEADLVTYGKIVGGGLPIGVVAGKAKYMNAMDGGPWSFGDDSRPAGGRTFFAGTFNKNPLGMAVARAVLSKLDEEGARLQDRLNHRTERFAAQMNRFFRAQGIPVTVAHFGSLFRFMSAVNLDPFFFRLLDKGVFVWEGRSCFFSTAHTDEDIGFVAAAVKEAALHLRKNAGAPASGPD